MIEEENIEPVPGVKPGSFAAWCASFRPKTLGIAAAPVIVGLSVSAAVTHTFDLIVAFATLALSLLMQAISNMEMMPATPNEKPSVSRAKDCRDPPPTGGLPSRRSNA